MCWAGLIGSVPVALSLALFIGETLTVANLPGSGLTIKLHLMLAVPGLLMAMSTLLWCLSELVREPQRPISHTPSPASRI